MNLNLRLNLCLIKGLCINLPFQFSRYPSNKSAKMRIPKNLWYYQFQFPGLNCSSAIYRNIWQHLKPWDIRMVSVKVSKLRYWQVITGFEVVDFYRLSQCIARLCFYIDLRAKKHIKFQEKTLIEKSRNTNRKLSSCSDTKNLSEVPSPFKLESWIISNFISFFT